MSQFQSESIFYLLEENHFNGNSPVWLQSNSNWHQPKQAPRRTWVWLEVNLLHVITSNCKWFFIIISTTRKIMCGRKERMSRLVICNFHSGIWDGEKWKQHNWLKHGFNRKKNTMLAIKWAENRLSCVVSVPSWYMLITHLCDSISNIHSFVIFEWSLRLKSLIHKPSIFFNEPRNLDSN